MKIFGINIFNKPSEVKSNSAATKPITNQPTAKPTPPDKFVQEPKIGNFYIEKLSYIPNTVKAIENLPAAQEKTIAEIKESVDQINNLSLKLPEAIPFGAEKTNPNVTMTQNRTEVIYTEKDPKTGLKTKVTSYFDAEKPLLNTVKEFKNGKLSKEMSILSTSSKVPIVEIQNYDENEDPLSRILSHGSGYDNEDFMVKIIIQNEDGSDKAIECYENGELNHLFIDPKNSQAGYYFWADNDHDGMGVNEVQQIPNTKNSIQYGQNMDNISEYNYTRLNYALNQNDLTGTVMVDKQNNKVYYWNTERKEDTPSVTFTPHENGLRLNQIDFDNPIKFEADGKTPENKTQITGIDKLPFETNVKNFDIDKIFEPINKLVPKIFPTSQRKEEIKNFSQSLLNL